ncbi:DUF6445 family protein [Sphingopyxis indica]|uniref:2OG-Fe(II) oxygenase superfamily protein n=1 Tax=Sphingopyxis indica TaxID=436663 RepID=A0A239DKQ9_9SPHN|nr:DUF6445 family protein [Sphingopyxis indica]SNS32789.1 hypothetical protein SAMN06295955_101313 [Sphingopyxis indica]
MPLTVEAIGAEAQPLCMLDDFAPRPDALRAVAAAAEFEAAKHHYPGIRGPIPGSYLESQLPIIAAAVRAVFGGSGAVDLIDASFSIVTTPPAALSVAQRLPHCDAFTPDRIALVHYLSPDGGDGTAFYRHRATGFECVTEERRAAYFAALAAEPEPPPAYVAGDTGAFEVVHRAEARYNRALLYRSWNLHSGAIAPDAALSADPLDGRLTVTAFLSMR